MPRNEKNERTMEMKYVRHKSEVCFNNDNLHSLNDFKKKVTSEIVNNGGIGIAMKGELTSINYVDINHLPEDADFIIWWESCN